MGVRKGEEHYVQWLRMLAEDLADGRRPGLQETYDFCHCLVGVTCPTEWGNIPRPFIYKAVSFDAPPPANRTRRNIVIKLQKTYRDDTHYWLCHDLEGICRVWTGSARAPIRLRAPLERRNVFLSRARGRRPLFLANHPANWPGARKDVRTWWHGKDIPQWRDK